MSDLADRIADLLVQAERAHGRYEATELNGVYDQDWPRWYAQYGVEHGIGALVGHDVSAQRLAELLAGVNADFEQLDPRPDEPWSAYAARRLSTEL